MCLHRVGTDPEADAQVFGEGRDKTQFYSVSVTADGRLARRHGHARHRPRHRSPPGRPAGGAAGAPGALQHASSGTGPVLLRLERGVGHGDRSASRAVALQAECLAFLAEQVGLPAPERPGPATP